MTTSFAHRALTVVGALGLAGALLCAQPSPASAAQLTVTSARASATPASGLVPGAVQASPDTLPKLPSLPPLPLPKGSPWSGHVTRTESWSDDFAPAGAYSPQIAFQESYCTGNQVSSVVTNGAGVDETSVFPKFRVPGTLAVTEAFACTGKYIHVSDTNPGENDPVPCTITWSWSATGLSSVDGDGAPIQVDVVGRLSDAWTVGVLDAVAVPVSYVTPLQFDDKCDRGVTILPNPYSIVAPIGEAPAGTLSPDALTAGAGFSGTYTYPDAPSFSSSSSDFSFVYTGDGELVVDRVFGSDRYDTAVQISKAAFPGTAPVVYVATGANYPDALAAGPAAVHLGGPLLLTDTNALLPAVKAEISRLKPAKIIVVGGINSLSAQVLSALKALQPATVRIGGSDRYETGRLLVADAFGATGATKAYVATGSNFPDALSAGPAASAADGPVVLVDGSAKTLSSATKALLLALNTTTVTIAGGTGSVGAGVESSLKSIASTTRQGGADRFETSMRINRAAFPTTQRAFLATGLAYPDALAASAWAGALPAPLYVTPSSCVPGQTLDALKAQGVTHVTLVGGTNSLAPDVERLVRC